jgi:GNAT superfamily N-acetyltransferase
VAGAGVTVEFRDAVPADVLEIVAMMAELAEHQGDPSDQMTAATLLRDAFGEDAIITLVVAADAGGLVGYVSFLDAFESSHAARGVFVTDLYVRPSHRRQGVARRLLAAVARRARNNERSYVWLVSTNWNKPAHAFYQSVADISEPVMAFAITGDRFEELADEALRSA